MTNLFFFGSDQYSATVLDYLSQHSNLTITHLTSLKSDLSHLNPQSDIVGLSASFPYLFSPDLISAFGGRLYNLHPSLLPQYRNVAPVPYALALGDTETGITLQRIDEKIDHGDILAQHQEPILPSDTTPLLLHRLFTLGAQMFLDHLHHIPLKSHISHLTSALIFTRKLTSESGHLEWSLVLKLIKDQPVSPADTSNPLVSLRLTHFPRRTEHILPDLIRALDGYEKVWTVAPTKKGDLRISFVPSMIPDTRYMVHISGRPRPISWSDFTQYYL